MIKARKIVFLKYCYIKSFLCILTLALPACGPGRLIVQSEHLKELNHYRTYRVSPIKFYPTLSAQDSLVTSQEEISIVIYQEFNRKGFLESRGASPDIRIEASILSANMGYISEEELRFMKGAHGSNFPSANPRLDKLEGDILKIEIVQNAGDTVFLSGQCKLESKRVEDGKNRLSITSALECVRHLLDDLPRS